MPELPLVSIVTPCLNMARFLETAIESVLSQDYPNIEYIVMDGGSTDGTPDILKRYAGRLRYHSGPDGGTAEAINTGLRESRGDIVAYLNADDAYQPGAIRAAVEALETSPNAAGVYGEGQWIDESGADLGPYPTRPFNPAVFASECFICQPASFVRRRIFDELNGFDATLRYTYDYDFWIRLSKAHHSLLHIGQCLAQSRMHRDTKTLGSRRAVFEENFKILLRHFNYVPFSWTYSYTCYRIDGRDQFFEPLQPSLAKYAASLPLGLWWNPRHPLRYIREWSQPMSWQALKRQRGAS